MDVKNIIKQFIPPILLSFINKPKQKYGFFGDYKNWGDVEKISSGYSSDTIIDKTRLSALKVKNGEAVYERDSVLFDKIEMSWPLLSAILLVAGINNNKLKLIDFGGALGTSYYQNKKFLKHITQLEWIIVEQDKFVEIGKKEFEDDILKFYKTPELKTLSENSIDLMIISSSLQFLEKPYEFMEGISEKISYIVFDKIPFFVDRKSNSKLMLQKVPPKIYDASYPVWIFGIDEFISKVKEKYTVLSEFDAYNGQTQKTENGQIKYGGFLVKRKQNT